MNIEDILDQQIDDRTKGVPGGTDPFKILDIPSKKWNILKEDLPLPLMVLKKSSMDHNAKTFREYTKKQNVLLAPHGKTTMCPQIFKQQFEDGAWGLTAATVNQVQVYRRYGVNRILLANQLLGEQNIRYIVEEINADPKFQFYCLIDSNAQLDLILTGLKKYKISRPLHLLIELGCLGGRTGFRNDEEARLAIDKINQSNDVLFSGVEAFEGILKTSEQVSIFMKRIKDFLEKLTFSNTKTQEEFIITAGGTSYFDLVISAFKGFKISRKIVIIIRSGCYITFDSGIYHKAIEKALEEKRLVPETLKSSLEIWSYVQSIPEAGLGILSMGKRDCPYDAGFPKVEKIFRPKIGFIEIQPQYFEITATNDQHAFLNFNDKSDIKIGDMICCGISHPCTAFDKWRFIPVVNDDYDVVDGYLTFF